MPVRVYSSIADLYWPTWSKLGVTPALSRVPLRNIVVTVSPSRASVVVGAIIT